MPSPGRPWTEYEEGVLRATWVRLCMQGWHDRTIARHIGEVLNRTTESVLSKADYIHLTYGRQRVLGHESR